MASPSIFESVCEAVLGVSLKGDCSDLEAKGGGMGGLPSAGAWASSLRLVESKFRTAHEPSLRGRDSPAATWQRRLYPLRAGGRRPGSQKDKSAFSATWQM